MALIHLKLEIVTLEFSFYTAALVSVLATVRVIFHTNAIHSLLYLIISLLAISVVFFSLGAYLAGALEIIVYAGAIMVLFVFVVMMLNLGQSEEKQERVGLKPVFWVGPSLLCSLLLLALIKGFHGLSGESMIGTWVSAKSIGVHLFSAYILAVELASMLLLAGLVVAFHLGKENKKRLEEKKRPASFGEKISKNDLSKTI